MPRTSHTRPRRAIISGHLLQLARASAGVTQEGLAEDLLVSRTAVQSWESGRRPLSAMSQGDALRLRQRLLTLGADAAILDLFAPAAEADFLLAAILDLPAASVDIDRHPLGWTVLRQTVAELVVWAASGQTPPACAGLAAPERRGPQSDRPEMDPGEPRQFFDALHVIADRARGRHSLLHRQAVFLSSADPNADASTWTRPDPAVTDHFRKPMGWTPHWPAARSFAVARARAGDPEPLLDFIKHADAAWEHANLAYWAYWCGDLATQPNDAFMAAPEGRRWGGTRLFAHLSRRLNPGSSRTELNVRSLHSLVLARPSLAGADPDAAARVLAGAEPLLDSGDLSARAEAELRSVHYALTVLTRITKERP